jgi:hypothetical protein
MGLKEPGHEAEYLPSSSAKIKNDEGCTVSSGT